MTTLPTHGRVVLDTTAGDIEIELWSKEAPKATRNFIALAMEGYYDGVIFHRVVPDFLVQTGDRTGTGSGGESFFGEQFEDEIHPRLRFAHRGLVGLANNGKKHTNDSQFFITLDRADELHGKNTLFGRCVGDSVYNVMKIGAMELDDTGRPLYPPKIRSVRIIENPFDDIVPRITAEEKRAQQKAREQSMREREEAARRKDAKKDTKLLSFGVDEDGDVVEVTTFKKKNIARPDLVENPGQPNLLADMPSVPPRQSAGAEAQEPEPKKKKPKTGEDDLTSIREKHAKEQAAKGSSRQAEIERMESEIKNLAKKRAGEDSDDEPSRKKAKSKSLLEEGLAKYAKGRGANAKGKKKHKNEDDVLAALDSFRSKIQRTTGDAVEMQVDGKNEGKEGEATGPGEDPGIEVDDDKGFLSHHLNFPKGNEEEVEKAEREYEVIDPRARGARAREEERERKRANKARDGGRRYHR
ncbi:cyclophilin-like protein [Vararia minispora EC-137]|uniref:Cyclophilin-like protein n=1 Tax=Vararia minispora EC-137 TaxID=1314806 RepID=A0ACB8QII0_9AGAM|nr:cyclophilin-like protein [Vararia minispora EC-137]